VLCLLILLFLAYFLLLLNYTIHWARIPVFKPRMVNEQRAFTVLIPARNEANNIAALLLALQGQHYPQALIEIIVIDDASSDHTADIVQQFPNVILLPQKNDADTAGKKKSIERGIQAAHNPWILTTDADCTPSLNWISTFNAYLDQQKAVCVVGPVSIRSIDGSVLQEFQRYDNLMFQGLTGAAIESGMHTLGNGANLCYRKESFEAVGGFQNIDALASGDDVLLIEKFMLHFPKQVHFLKSATALVNTPPASTWKAFWQQRVRWVSKAHAYQGWRLHLAQWITGLFNLILLIQTLWCIVYPNDWKITVSIWIFKAMIEWPLIHQVAGLYANRRSFLIYLILEPLHVGYLVAIGLFGRRTPYQWKGRSVR
jgi:biofilm PGA synthesis N-glycosyltransferase PgaC